MSAYLMPRMCLRSVGTVLLGACFLWVSLPAAWQEAQSLTSGGVSCFVSPAKLSDEAVAQFMANPPSLLAMHPSGGVSFANLVRTLAGSDFRTVDPLIELAKNGSPSIKADIAVGLANAAGSCNWTRPDIAQLIKEKIAASQDAQLITAFLGVAGAIQTTAVRDAPTLSSGGAGRIGGAALGSGSGIEPNATRQGGGLAGFTGGDRTSFTANNSNIERDRIGANSPSSPSSNSSITSGFDSKVGSNASFRANSAVNSSGISRLFTPDSPVSQTVQ